ncbi:hypothetical protein [uncultured Helicobacter sp.]|uniref:hypothetical protein n=1 Tax=uncultured Helicobacter sp. TaxID=175537 RepID=UPI002729B1B5|nr:hypothetical protein [uncultured Helicobacter sp.]
MRKEKRSSMIERVRMMGKNRKTREGTEVGYTGIEKDKASPDTNYTYIIYKETMATIFFINEIQGCHKPHGIQFLVNGQYKKRGAYCKKQAKKFSD